MTTVLVYIYSWLEFISIKNLTKGYLAEPYIKHTETTYYMFTYLKLDNSELSGSELWQHCKRSNIWSISEVLSRKRRNTLLCCIVFRLYIYLESNNTDQNQVKKAVLKKQKLFLVSIMSTKVGTSLADIGWGHILHIAVIVWEQSIW